MPETTPPVVVGIDGSDNCVGAARWAAALASRLATSLHLVHSSATTDRLISDAAVIAIRAAAVADQRTAGEKVVTVAGDALQAEFPDLAVETDIVTVSAREALTRLSRDAEFIVIASENVNPMAALLLGSTSLAVTTHARCPVVAWRAVPRPSEAPVVVGVDGTAAGTAALGAAFAFADLFGAPVRVVHAWSTGVAGDQSAFPFLVDWAAIEEAEWSLLGAAVQPWTQRYPAVEVENHVEVGKPATVLLDHCSDAQLVVVGDHRTNSIAATVLGSTSLNLSHHSPVPVMVCHARPEPA